jgi:glutaredoxin
MPVPGENKKIESVFLFSLSTCGMCRRVKQLLSDLAVDFDFLDVDLLDEENKDAAKRKMRNWDRRVAFPMLIINNTTCIVGDEPELIREALGK